MKMLKLVQSLKSRQTISKIVVLILIGFVSIVALYVMSVGIITLDHSVSSPDSIINVTVENNTIAIDDPGKKTVSSWAVFNMQFVPVEVSHGATDAPTTSNALPTVLTTIPYPLLYMVPIFILMPTGYISTRYLGMHQSTLTTALIGSIGFLIGYIPGVIALLQIAKWEIQFIGLTISYSVPVILGIILAGGVFPVAYASIGGSIAYSQYLMNNSSENDEEDELNDGKEPSKGVDSDN